MAGEEKPIYKTISQSGRTKKLFYQMRYAIVHDKTGMAGFVILATIIVLSIISPVVFPIDRTADVTAILQGPSKTHILGTDYLGQDVWAQVANGGRELLLFALVAALIGTALGVIMGTFAPLIGGKFDEGVRIFADVWMSVPRLPLLVVLAGFTELTSMKLAIILGVLSWAGLYRTIRSQVLSLKESEFIEAAQMLNLSKAHIVFKEMVPNIMGFITVNFTLLMRGCIYSQVGLVFMGLLPMEQNWGVMINMAWRQGAVYNPSTIAYILSPTIMICLLIVSLVWVGNALEDVFNPELRR